MAASLRLVMHLTTGQTIKSYIDETEAREILAEEWRYTFPSPDLDERDKLIAIVTTRIAMAIEQPSGSFVLSGENGELWVFAKAAIAACALEEVAGSGAPIVFGPPRMLEIKASRETD